MSGLGNGLSLLFKGWGRGIGKAADNFLSGGADARKAISDEVVKKFERRIAGAHKAESKRAENIKDLGDKLAQSKQDLANAQKTWQDKYDSALADAKSQRQTDINNYDTELKGYQNALADANTSRQSIIDQLYDQEATYTPTKTIYTDVKSGDKYIVTPVTGEYKNLTQAFKNASKTQRRAISKYVKGFDERLLDTSSGTPKVINAFDDATFKSYHGKSSIFDTYLDRVKAPKSTDLRDADNQIKQANGNLSTWQTNNSRPADWNDANDLKTFGSDFEKTNGKLPSEYSFNGQTYSKKKDLEDAYNEALKFEKAKRDIASRGASRYASERDAEIAQRIQDAKDIKKAKLALGGALGAGALYAGARAMYGGDDTDNTDNIDNTNNIDNTDNTYTGKPDPDFNVEKEGQAILNDRLQVDTGFDPDKADALAAAATLADAAHDTGVEDSNSIESSDDHFIDDAELYKLLKAMEDPYKADAVANYIYSKHGNESDVQNLGWRGWLNKYYGDLLRSRMNIDPSGYNGMHISGGL